VKPIITESTTSIKNNVVDAASATSVNSLDNRLQFITKSTTSEPFLIFTNYDGTTAGVTLPSSFQGSFILPLINNSTTSISSSGFSDFFFIKDGVPSGNNSTYGVTLNTYTNNGKRYYVNSSGYLSKVPNNTTVRINYGFNIDTNSWEKKGLLLEPSSTNLITPAWNRNPVFGATGATANIATDYSAGYWDTTTIPAGMTVWKLEEISTPGFSAENTVIIPSGAISFGSNRPTSMIAYGISFSSFMVSAFFTGPNKIGGITKDHIQMWLATNPSGTQKKSIYFNLSTCQAVSVSSGGTTLAFYNTELYANGWCRCWAGVGLTGATWPSQNQIPQFGFSTARPDGSGGYTYGRLASGTTGFLYFSGLKINMRGSNDGVTGAPGGQLYSFKNAPDSYLDPLNGSINGSCQLIYETPKTPSWFFPSTSYLTGGMQNSVFYDMTLHSAAGITEGQGTGTVIFFNGRLKPISGTVVGQNYAQSLVIARGLSQVGVPIPRISYYNLQRAKEGVFNGVLQPSTPDRDLSHYTRSNVIQGFTVGQRFKYLITAATGSWKSYLNGLTFFAGSGFTAPIFPSDTNHHQPWEFSIQNITLDKILNIMNWAYTSKVLSEAEGIATTSFTTQGIPTYRFLGSGGGYNETNGTWQSVASIVTSANNTSPILPPSRYPDITIAVL